jgi:hypothetical protein
MAYSISELRITIISKMPCHSIDASHHCPCRTIGCCGLPGRDGVGSGVCFVRCLGGDPPVLLGVQHVWGLLAVQFLQARHSGIWFAQSIARCLSIPAFTLMCPGNPTLRFFSSRTTVCIFLIRYCDSAIAERENPPLPILAMFKAWHMSDYSSCTLSPCHAIVADMLNSNNRLVNDSINETQPLPQPHMLP